MLAAWRRCCARAACSALGPPFYIPQARHCIFLQPDNTCAVHPVRPVQCSTYRERRPAATSGVPRSGGRLKESHGVCFLGLLLFMPTPRTPLAPLPQPGGRSCRTQRRGMSRSERSARGEPNRSWRHSSSITRVTFAPVPPPPAPSRARRQQRLGRGQSFSQPQTAALTTRTRRPPTWRKPRGSCASRRPTTTNASWRSRRRKERRGAAAHRTAGRRRSDGGGGVRGAPRAEVAHCGSAADADVIFEPGCPGLNTVAAIYATVRPYLTHVHSIA